LAHGATISLREFIVGAFDGEMGLQAQDPDVTAASAGAQIVTPAGMVLDGARDRIDPPRELAVPQSGSGHELPTSLVDHLEFYLLNYFKPGTYRQTRATRLGRHMMEAIGCTQCHIPDLPLTHDRRVADVETVYDPARGGFNRLFATATPLYSEVEDGSGFPPLKRPLGQPFLVRNIFADFKRHDLGPQFHERHFTGAVTTRFMTTPLWGVGSTSPYGHDGRSINLEEVILRHGGRHKRRARRLRTSPRARRPRCSDFSSRSCCSRRTTRRRTSIPAVSVCGACSMIRARVNSPLPPWRSG
jgi:CxxC motif-containing protein (DUF1111 family)